MAGDRDVAHDGYLRRLLLDAGVGTKPLTLQELKRRSGLSLHTWQRMLAPVTPAERGERFGERTLRKAADALQDVRVTFEQMDHAAWMDSATLGYGSAATSDDIRDMAMVLVQSLPHATQLEFLSDLAARVAAKAAQVPENSARDRQQEGSSDDQQDPHPRPD